MNSSSQFRKSAQGKLLGVALPSTVTSIEEIRQRGVTLISAPLQTAEKSAFKPDGTLDSSAFSDLQKLLEAANRAEIVVELVFFHPTQDHNFDSHESFFAAIRRTTDWLIDNNHRNVFLNIAGDWNAAGWDFDAYVPAHLEQLADAARSRFQERHTDFALPISIAVRTRINERSPIVNAADLIILSGEAVATDTKRIERPTLVLGESCAAEFVRSSGCLLESPDTLPQLTPLFLSAHSGSK
jgi:hypothetical protein